jgi:hypothetical protein
MEKKPQNSFETSNGEDGNVLSDLFSFLIQNKKWWLIPIVLILLGLGVLLVLSGTVAAPFIYSLF